MQGRDLASKVIGLWWPVFAFVSLGLDHVVANMFIIPMGIWLETPDVTVVLYIWKGTISVHSASVAVLTILLGIIPAALGNMVGGALFCGMYYWWMFSCGAEPIHVDGVYYDGHLATPTPMAWRRGAGEKNEQSHGRSGSGHTGSTV